MNVCTSEYFLCQNCPIVGISKYRSTRLSSLVFNLQLGSYVQFIPPIRCDKLIGAPDKLLPSVTALFGLPVFHCSLSFVANSRNTLYVETLLS